MKLTLLTDEEIVRFFPLSNSFTDEEIMQAIKVARVITGECEQRALEKVKEVARWFSYERYPFWDKKQIEDFEEEWEIFLKEQENQEAITLLKEWKERDGSEIEENYNKLIKEQENGMKRFRQIPEPKIKDRWSDGVDHEPESIALVELIGQMDFEHFDDHFCWKTGGDGDNGECLAYIIDALIENGLIEIKIKEQDGE